MNEHDSQLWANYIRTRSDADRNALVMQYINLAEKLAVQTWQAGPSRADVDDMKQQALLGLMSAIPRFDPSRGIEPTTFLSRRIKGSVLDWLREIDFVPRLERVRRRKYARAAEALRKTLKREPTENEIREYLGVSAEEFDRITKAVAGTVQVHSFNHVICKSPDGRALELAHAKLIDPSPDPYTLAERNDLIQVLLRRLPPKMSFVFVHYFMHDETMGEIGQQLGYSDSMISQLFIAARKRLSGRDTVPVLPGKRGRNRKSA